MQRDANGENSGSVLQLSIDGVAKGEKGHPEEIELVFREQLLLPHEYVNVLMKEPESQHIEALCLMVEKGQVFSGEWSGGLTRTEHEVRSSDIGRVQRRGEVR